MIYYSKLKSVKTDSNILNTFSAPLTPKGQEHFPHTTDSLMTCLLQTQQINDNTDP